VFPAALLVGAVAHQLGHKQPRQQAEPSVESRRVAAKWSNPALEANGQPPLPRAWHAPADAAAEIGDQIAAGACAAHAGRRHDDEAIASQIPLAELADDAVVATATSAFAAAAAATDCEDEPP